PEVAGVRRACRNVPATLNLAAQRIHFALRQLGAAVRLLAAERGFLGRALGAASGRLFLVQQRRDLVGVERLFRRLRLRRFLLHRLFGVLAVRRLGGLGLWLLRPRLGRRRAVGQLHGFADGLRRLRRDR